MNFVWLERYWVFFLALLAFLPGLVLLVRGLVWGADSFAFWAVSCGVSKYASALSSPQWFVWFIQNIVSCNLFVLVGVMWFLYFFALLGIYFFARRFFVVQAWRLSFYVAALTPLFFIEALRFENDFFVWALAFVALGCFSLFCENKSKIMLGFGVILACFSFSLWIPSVFVLLLVVFLYRSPVWWHYVVISAILLVFLLPLSEYLVHSLVQGVGLNAVAEEIPFVGIVFILHILHFYKKIPMPLLYYGWFLLGLGILKSKYVFLATPLLLMGLLKQQQERGLSIPKLGVKEIPVLFFVLLLGMGWFISCVSLYPTQGDMQELSQAIKLSKDLNVSLYNDWGDGWMLVSLGHDTKYKVSPPQPDWNNLSRPFVAWSQEEIVGCYKIAKKTQQCN